MLIHLHIGIDKAGSSAIQSNMKLNRDWFHNKALFIPSTGLVSTGYRKVFSDLSPEIFEQLYKELNYAEALGFKHAFMSWEGINYYSVKKINTLRHRFKDHEVRIYVYLREQAEVIQSGYFQIVKTGRELCSLSEFHENAVRFSPPARDYAKMLNRFAKVFGERSINVRIFDRAHLKQSNVVVDMLDMLGLEPDTNFSLRPGEDNPSLDMASTSILNLLDAEISGNRWGGDITDRGLLPSLSSALKSPVARRPSDSLQLRVSAILDLYYGDSAQGRVDVVDVLLNIIDMEGKVGKYFLTETECDLIKSFYAQSNREVVARFFDNDWPNPELFPYSKRPVVDANTASIDSAIPARLDAIVSTGDHRTWNGVPLKGKDLAKVAAIADGWSDPTESGMRCDATESKLRFRVDWKHINFIHNKLALVSRAQVSKEYINSTLFVNGQDFGLHDLRQAQIDIPLTLLRPLGLIDIIMQHHFSSPDGSTHITSVTDKPKFTLTVLRYMLRK